MKGNLYEITLKHLEDPKGNSVNSEVLTFQIKNHDDLGKIIDLAKNKKIFNESDTISLALGLKLFGEVILNNRDSELFKELQPHFKDFMKKIKSF